LTALSALNPAFLTAKGKLEVLFLGSLPKLKAWPVLGVPGAGTPALPVDPLGSDPAADPGDRHMKHQNQVCS
jgi:hypothetical protein